MIGLELESLSYIVDLCGQYVIRLFELEFLGNLPEGDSFLKLLRSPRVLAENLDHVLKCIYSM